MTNPEPLHPDIQLAELAAQYKYDPLGYVRIAFPWGEKGTPLEHHQGPCPCQVKLCTILGEEMRKRGFDGVHAVMPIRIGCASGHGIGKSAFFGMITDWIRVCWPRSQGSATANTYTQLSTKTWANIRKWQRLSVFAHWFEATSDRIYHPEEKDSWFLSTQSSSEENSEAFAGQHAADSISYYVNDECSGIPDVIFEVQEGGLTDGCPIQFAFGNPTKRTGKFARIMAGQERGWIRIRIDSRDCPFTNKAQIAEWVSEYGEDSDFVKVRVRGLPPSVDVDQFIGLDLVMAAQAKSRIAAYTDTDPLITGCDLSWGGEDRCCIRFRRGCDARTIQPIYIEGEQTRDPNTMVRVLADVLSRTYSGRRVDMLFIDSAGICGPVVRALRELGFKNIIEVNFGAHSSSPKYKLMRSYMWGMLREALPQLAIDSSADLADDLTAPNYSYTSKTEILLEPKQQIRLPDRLGRSTDDGDALALTYAMPVASRDAQQQRHALPGQGRVSSAYS